MKASKKSQQSYDDRVHGYYLSIDNLRMRGIDSRGYKCPGSRKYRSRVRKNKIVK